MAKTTQCVAEVERRLILEWIVQGAPIKNSPLKKFIISVTVTDFSTKFTFLQRRIQAT